VQQVGIKYYICNQAILIVVFSFVLFTVYTVYIWMLHST